MPLEQEIAAFEAMKSDLLNHHKGKFALIVGQELLGIYDNSEEAYNAGVDQKGNVPMLIKHIVPEEPVKIIPALSLGLIRGDL